jgi:hypothetical protein
MSPRNDAQNAPRFWSYADQDHAFVRSCQGTTATHSAAIDDSASQNAIIARVAALIGAIERITYQRLTNS